MKFVVDSAVSNSTDDLTITLEIQGFKNASTAAAAFAAFTAYKAGGGGNLFQVLALILGLIGK